MKPQDAVFALVIVVLAGLRKPVYFVCAGLGSLLLATKHMRTFVLCLVLCRNLL